ncbi:MAG: thiamine/thiamine pyrophosphate ABC transporter permease ThiP [Paracoccaceae bacterium]
MAYRAQPLGTFFGVGALLVVAFLLLGPLVALWLRADATSGLQTSDWAAIRFTIFQAILSAFISVAAAIPVARALARRQFYGRSAIITLLGAPFLLPVIVAILGLLAIWGRSGIVSHILLNFGADRLNIYGLSGVLLAHVFFNLPLATRMILQGWSAIPSEHFRLAAQLGMTAGDIQKRLEWPMLKGILPGAFLLVFLLCTTSFAVALTLGGGPKATTIELAIYQALRFDFDLSKAAILGLVQFAICAGIAILSLRITFQADFGAGLVNKVQRWDTGARYLLWQDSIILIAVTLFLGAPLVMILWRGAPSLGHMPASVWPATLNSLLVALFSAGFSLLLALSLARFIDRLKARKSPMAGLSEVLGLLTLSASPFVLGTGLFILIHPLTNPFSLALPVTALVNAAISLPLALRLILPALAQNRQNYGRLADSLDITGFARFRIVLWPTLQAPLGFAAGLAAALSMGDLGVITLFAPPDVETLPLVMYRLMGAYRMEAAASVALLLVSLTLTVFWIFDRGGRLGRHS